MTRKEIEAWAAAYIVAQLDSNLLKGDHPLWWAVERFMPGPSTRAPAEDCWAAILEVLSRNPPEQVIAVLAAGPLEDLIDDHGPEFIERIETESRRNASFRKLLGGVWKSSTPDVWARVQKAQGELW